MYLFTRSARLGSGNMREAMAWAVGITEKVNQITDLGVTLWSPLFSPGTGTLTWSAAVPDLTALEASDQKLNVDDLFAAEVDRGAAFLNGQGIEDALAQVVHGEMDPNNVPQYVTVVTATMSNGALEKGMAAGIEIAERATKLGGLATSFMINATGAYGGVSWVTGAPSIQELERAEQAVNGDPDFIKLVDKRTKDVYENEAQQSIYRRIA